MPFQSGWHAFSHVDPMSRGVFGVCFKFVLRGNWLVILETENDQRRD
jgi:hypothetical protein